MLSRQLGKRASLAEASGLHVKTKVPVAFVSKDRGLQHKTASTKDSYVKISTTTKPIRVALAESDPLRLVGFRALLESESDLELISTPLPEIALQENIDVVLIGDRPGHNLRDTISNLKMIRPKLPIIVVGARTNDEIMLNAIVCGAKGYVFDGPPPSEFARAIRVVGQGLVWAPRRVVSMFIELATTQPKRMPGANVTEREKQVLKMLVAGLSTRKLGNRSVL